MMPLSSSTETTVVVDKVYKAYHQQNSGLPFILRRGLLGGADVPQEENTWALQDISLQLRRGEILGIIGANGAGKSTLLRIVAGFSAPSRGRVALNGRLSSMLSLSAGLLPELTGRNNIRTMGPYYGRSPQETEKLMKSIIDFADLGEFIDHPVHTYSSGMQARLAFSVVTGFGFHDILLIDEALGAGDARFAVKSAARVHQVIKQGGTVLLVSHSMQTISSLCSRVIWLEHGRIIMDGDPVTVTKAYLEYMAKKREKGLEIQLRGKVKNRSDEFEIEKVELLDASGQAHMLFRLGEMMQIRISYHSRIPQSNVEFRVALQRADGALIFDETSDQKCDLSYVNGKGVIDIFLETILFAQGDYRFIVSALNQQGETIAIYRTSLQVEDIHYTERGGIPLIFHPVTWEWKRDLPNEKG
jgi:lipopolysaccharide transport system ATP-binding protein